MKRCLGLGSALLSAVVFAEALKVSSDMTITESNKLVYSPSAFLVIFK